MAGRGGRLAIGASGAKFSIPEVLIDRRAAARAAYGTSCYACVRYRYAARETCARPGRQQQAAASVPDETRAARDEDAAAE